jgi:hypothetical protein
MASERKILMVHGVGPKPERDVLGRLWREALRLGLERDAPDQLERFDQTSSELFYFADRLERFHDRTYDVELDTAQREQVLERLGRLGKARDFRRRHYEELPGKSPLKEFAMDLGASVGLGRFMLGKAVPELAHYWSDRDWADRLRGDFVEWLGPNLRNGTDILLVTHCIGSVLAYDGLWSMSAATASDDPGLRVSAWLTLGSPLGDSAVHRRLLGAGEKGNARFPRNILAWHNLAAEDDYMCHDKTVVDDFGAMLDARIIGDITDHTIYNLAVRYGRSNPHHSTGYLVHPRTAQFVAEWLAR